MVLHVHTLSSKLHVNDNDANFFSHLSLIQSFYTPRAASPLQLPTSFLRLWRHFLDDVVWILPSESNISIFHFLAPRKSVYRRTCYCLLCMTSSCDQLLFLIVEVDRCVCEGFTDC
jgi:hypothetical protein